ncbi:MAG: hypothetical protein ACRDF0_09330 [Candidatus Limnocylindria bacterium]
MITDTELSIEVWVDDGDGSGVQTSPSARAELLGVGLALLTSDWDASLGRYRATFLLSGLLGDVLISAEATDAAGNVGSASAITTIK